MSAGDGKGSSPRAAYAVQMMSPTTKDSWPRARMTHGCQPAGRCSRMPMRHAPTTARPRASYTVDCSTAPVGSAKKRAVSSAPTTGTTSQARRLRLSRVESVIRSHSAPASCRAGAYGHHPGAPHQLPERTCAVDPSGARVQRRSGETCRAGTRETPSQVAGLGIEDERELDPPAWPVEPERGLPLAVAIDHGAQHERGESRLRGTHRSHDRRKVDALGHLEVRGPGDGDRDRFGWGERGDDALGGPAERVRRLGHRLERACLDPRWQLRREEDLHADPAALPLEPPREVERRSGIPWARPRPPRARRGEPRAPRARRVAT